MNKAELVENVALSLEISKVKSNELVTAVLEAIKESLIKEEKVTLIGFGTFDTPHRDARKGRNPKTGEEIPITARRVVTFHASQKLKGMVDDASGQPLAHAA